MTKKFHNDSERVLYASRFRRNLNGLMKAINHPNKTLQRVVVTSRRTEKPVVVAISASAYALDIEYVKANQQFLDKPL